MILWLIESHNVGNSDLLCNVSKNDSVVLLGEAVYAISKLQLAIPAGIKALEADCHTRGIQLEADNMLTLEQLLTLIRQTNNIVRV